MKLTNILLLAACLVGCASAPVAPTNVVTVDKPIAVVPKPPEVPVFASQVDALTPADIKDPGKVGQAYRYDVTMLRSLVKIYQMILAQYTTSSYQFEAIEAEINNLFSKQPQ